MTTKRGKRIDDPKQDGHAGDGALLRFFERTLRQARAFERALNSDPDNTSAIDMAIGGIQASAASGFHAITGKWPSSATTTTRR